MTSGTCESRFVLATSNGTGMGHLTRQICTALALRQRGAEAVVFSMSAAVPVVRIHDLRAEYCPSYQRGWLPQSAWHGYLNDRLRAIVGEVAAKVVVFDGVVPYLGLLRARAALPEVAFVWCRRGLWTPGANTGSLRARPFFDVILEPGDLAGGADQGATSDLDDAIRLPPMSLLEHVTPLSRRDASAALGLDPDRPTALVTLGSGALNDPNTPGRAAILAILAAPDWQVAVTRAHIAERAMSRVGDRRVVELRGVYPLSAYLNAFDAAVSASGYNTFHELLFAGIPTVFVPRVSGTDDQVARARWAADQGLSLVAEEANPASVGARASQLCDPRVRADLRAACTGLARPSGSTVAARALAGLATEFRRHQPRIDERLHTAELTARATAVRLLGPAATSAIRHLLLRPAHPGPVRPVPVRLTAEATARDAADHGQEVPGALVMTERLDQELLRARDPVEHVLEGSSAGYRADRARITRRYYDVRANA